MNKKISSISILIISIIYGFFCISIIILYGINILPSIINKVSGLIKRPLLITTFISILIIAIISLLIFISLVRKYKLIGNNLFNVLVILTCVIIPRIVWVSVIQITPKSDFLLYYNLAGEYAQSNFIGGAYVSLFPHTFGYPFILSFFYRLMGSSVIVAQILNIILSCSLSLLIYRLGSMIDNWKVGFFAAIVWALWPSQIMYTALVSTETLFTVILFCCINIFIYALHYEGKRSIHVFLFLLLGLVCSIMNAIRPFGLLIIIAFVIYYLVFYAIEKRKMKILYNASLIVLFILSYSIFFNIFSFGISNAIGRDIAKSPIGFNLYVGSNLKYTGVWNAEDSSKLYEVLEDNLSDAQRTQDKLAVMAINRFESQKANIIKLFIDKFKVIWLKDSEIINYLKAGFVETNMINKYISKKWGLLEEICNLYYILVLSFNTISLYYLIKRNVNKGYLLLALLVLGIFGVHTLVEVHGRYHFPSISIFALFAGCSFNLLINNMQKSNRNLTT